MEKALGASLEGRSDTSSGSEPNLTSTYISKSASDYMPAPDLRPSLGGIACFAYANCSIEGSNGAGCSQTTSNQSSKEGNVTWKEKQLRPPRNFNFVHLQRMVAYITF